MSISVPNPSASATVWHDQRRRVLDRERETLLGRSRRVSHVRVFLFLGIIGALGWVEASGTGGTTNMIPAAGLVIVFIFAVFYHHRLKRMINSVEAAHTCHTEAVQRLDRNWNQIESVSVDIPDGHPYASDLDVAGKASLVSLLSAVRTPFGRDVLVRWLLDGGDPDRISSRREAVVELRDKRVFREAVEVAARIGVRPSSKSLHTLLEWLAQPSWTSKHRWIVWFARVSGLGTGLLIIAHLSGFIPYAFWLLPIAVNFSLSRWYLEPAREAFSRVERGSGSLVACQRILALFEGEVVSSSRLQDLQRVVRSPSESASQAIHRVRRLADWCGIRRSWIAPVLQGLFMWEIHLLVSLEKWRERWRERASTSFDIVAEVEILAAFGGLADDQPNWCFPSVRDDAPKVSATGLGHPLLSDESRVCNDVEIGPRGTFLFVTGSNMSGKSTLLRAVGLNVLLARCGAPVCAETFTLPPVDLYTNMRVQDSLIAGESYFLAALRRLKLVVDAARNASKAGGSRVLYLLDEILQGTNSAERKIAVGEVLRELLTHNTLGAVTSHDLTIADAEDLQRASQPVHLAEQVSGEGESMMMTFDYKLRPGIAPTTNALRLMEIVGLTNVQR